MWKSHDFFSNPRLHPQLHNYIFLNPHDMSRYVESLLTNPISKFNFNFISSAKWRHYEL